MKASDTECQNDRGTKSSSAGERQKVGRPSSKVKRENCEILHSKETITKKESTECIPLSKLPENCHGLFCL